MKLTPEQVDELLVGTKYEGCLEIEKYSLNPTDSTQHILHDARSNAALAIHYKALAGELVSALEECENDYGHPVFVDLIARAKAELGE